MIGIYGQAPLYTNAYHAKDHEQQKIPEGINSVGIGGFIFAQFREPMQVQLKYHPAEQVGPGKLEGKFPGVKGGELAGPAAAACLQHLRQVYQ